MAGRQRRQGRLPRFRCAWRARAVRSPGQARYRTTRVPFGPSASSSASCDACASASSSAVSWLPNPSELLCRP